jgi:6-phosphogluconolactonase
VTGTVAVLAGAPALAEAAADRLAAWLDAALRARGTASLAVSGGATPVLTHRALARRPLDWSRVHVWFCDERAVPPGDPESNYRLANETLVGPAGIPDANVHRMIGEAPDLDAEAERYARELPAALDVLLLGIGPDGHTCSLFPGSALVTERARRVAAVFDSPKPPPRRITLTPPVLAAAGEALMLVEGQEKADAVARALDPASAPQQVPASLVRDRTWLLDAAAAARLPAARGGRPG